MLSASSRLASMSAAPQAPAPAAKKAEAPTSSKDKNTIELEATLTLPTGADAKD